MNKEKIMFRKRICFYGRVQSVGFRFQAQQAARRMGVTGWVQNEYDGSVTMEIQGTQEQINSVIAEIDENPYIRIECMKTKWLDPIPDERSFKVKSNW